MKYSLRSLMIVATLGLALPGCMSAVPTDEPAKIRVRKLGDEPGEKEPITAETQRVIVELEKDFWGASS